MQIMEIQSPNILKSFDSQGRNSFKSSSRSSVIRYTPNEVKEERSVTLMELFQDSLEVPRTKSRLLNFNEKENLPIPQKSVLTHSRKHSLNHYSKPNSISEMLSNLREKPKPKSSLKHNVAIKKHKTVSFCSHIELSSPDTVIDSVIFCNKQILEDSLEVDQEKSILATTVNSTLQELPTVKYEKHPDTTMSTQQNVEITESTPEIEETRKTFEYEEDIRRNLTARELEFNEFSTIAYCNSCNKETVTQVGFEKVRGTGCIDITEWLICWVMPACMYRKKVLVHSCSFCKSEIMKLEYN